MTHLNVFHQLRIKILFVNFCFVYYFSKLVSFHDPSHLHPLINIQAV